PQLPAAQPGRQSVGPRRAGLARLPARPKPPGCAGGERLRDQADRTADASDPTVLGHEWRLRTTAPHADGRRPTARVLQTGDSPAGRARPRPAGQPDAVLSGAAPRLRSRAGPQAVDRETAAAIGRVQ